MPLHWGSGGRKLRGAHWMVNRAELVSSRPGKDPVSKTKEDGISRCSGLSSDLHTRHCLHTCAHEHTFTQTQTGCSLKSSTLN